MRYYKSVFSFFLISVLFWNTLYVSFTYTYYYIDQSGFIERFCENIDKPEMECNGKCHLKDVVEKKTTGEKAPLNLIITDEKTLFFDYKKDKELVINIFDKGKQIDRYLNLYSYNRIYSLYHPPKV